ncbi:MAG: hypothetical protein AAF438_20340, partial [Pseudomonadota bacterium]
WQTTGIIGSRQYSIRRSAMADATHRFLILGLLFLAATISYVVGFGAGLWGFIAAGVVFELYFWVQLLVKRNKP